MSIGIADVFASVRLNLETGQFEADAVKAADKAGLTMGQRMKKAVGGMVGAGLGAGLGMALAGANKLDTVARQLAADTGMTADEAKRATGSLAGMYRGNLQGFDAISAAMAKVHNDLGLTGEAADEATEQFLKFGTATGQDAAEAVASFDDILDAWNLTAEDAAGLMDGLIADHQEFGGVIKDSQDALAAMAPAMQAANMEIEDGRALLNLFNASGIDSSKAAAALNKAVLQLKPGQSLNDLIARIGAIEDPTLRAQEAMRVFGAKSGIGLAQAIKPGMTSLDDYTVSVEDAAGATQEAAGVIENSFGNRLKLALKGAEGYLAEFGTSFGDLVMVAAMLGPKMTTALMSGIGAMAGLLAPKLAAMWTAAAGSGVVTKAIAIAGGKAATLYLGALIVGDKMGVALAGAWTAASNSPVLQKAAQLAGTRMGGFVAAGLLLGLGAAAASNMAQEGNAYLGLPDDATMSDRSQEIWRRVKANHERDSGVVQDALNAIGEKAGRDMAQGWVQGVESTKPEVAQAAGAMYGPVITLADRAAVMAEKAGAETSLGLAAGITAARQAPLDAFSTLKEMLRNAMTPMGEIARLHGQLTSRALARGLKSGDPAVRAQAAGVAKAAANRLGELAAGGGKAGRAAMRELDKGIRSKIPAVRDASIAAKNVVVAKLEAAKGPAGNAGTAAGNAFVAKMRSAVAAGDFKVKAGFTIGLGVQHRAAGGPIASPSWVGEKGPEIYVPQQAGRILSHEDSMAAVAGRGTGSTNITIYNPEPRAAESDIGRVLRRTAALGMA